METVSNVTVRLTGERFRTGTGFRLRFVSYEEIDEGDREARRKEVINLAAEGLARAAPDAEWRGWRTCI